MSAKIDELTFEFFEHEGKNFMFEAIEDYVTITLCSPDFNKNFLLYDKYSFESLIEVDAEVILFNDKELPLESFRTLENTVEIFNRYFPNHETSF